MVSKELEEISKAVKSIKQTGKKYYTTWFAPDIIVEEDGADVKLHIPPDMYRAFVSNTLLLPPDKREPMSETIAKCTVCGQEFKNLDQLEEHKRANHPTA